MMSALCRRPACSLWTKRLGFWSRKENHTMHRWIVFDIVIKISMSLLSLDKLQELSFLTVTTSGLHKIIGMLCTQSVGLCQQQTYSAEWDLNSPKLFLSIECEWGTRVEKKLTKRSEVVLISHSLGVTYEKVLKKIRNRVHQSCWNLQENLTSFTLVLCDWSSILIL